MNMVIYTPDTVTCLKMRTAKVASQGVEGRCKLCCVLGTIGRRAPFHSQRQKMPITAMPLRRVARTFADVQGNVTPP